MVLGGAKLVWWKWLAIGLLYYTIFGGLLMQVPKVHILNESIRNLYFHVPMWFAMMIMLGASVWHSIQYLRKGKLDSDRISAEAVNTGVLFGILGLLTGMVWANYTWGTPWTNDPKLNSAAIGMLMYLAYLVLRGSFQDEILRARVCSVYNIFAYAIFIPLIFILPRLTDSLHPGNGGNPGFNAYDLDANLRLVFYPAVLGWSLLGWWLTTLRVRILRIELNQKPL